MSPASQPWVTVPVALLVFGVPFAFWTVPGTVVAMVLWTAIALGLIKTEVTVGADAVSTSWLGWRKAVLLRDITAVTVTPRHWIKPRVVRLHLHDGRTFDIAVGVRGHPPFEPLELEDECQRIAERVREAMTLRADVGAPEWSMRPSELSPKEWLASLRAQRDAGYRHSALPQSAADLFALIESPTVDPATRGAAAALIAIDDHGRARMRSVATRTAIPRLRVALEAAADGDEERLLEAIEALREDAHPIDARVGRISG